MQIYIDVCENCCPVPEDDAGEGEDEDDGHEDRDESEDAQTHPGHRLTGSLQPE